MIAIVAIISASITLENYLFFLVVGIIKCYSPCKFDDYNIVYIHYTEH